MKLLDSLRLRIATLFHPSQVNTEMEEELRSHIQLRADDLERSGLPRPKPSGARASNSADVRSTKKNATKRWATILSRPCYRMCASAFACCASLRDSQSPPF